MGFRPARLVLVVVMMAGFTAIDARPAAAFASTGTVTVLFGHYVFFARTDPTGYGDPVTTTYSRSANFTMTTTYCADGWAGTTSTGTGAGATCYIGLSGSWWSNQTNTSGTSMDFWGGYRNSNGAWSTLLLGGGGPVSHTGPGTMTGTIISPDGHAGPVTATYTLLPDRIDGCPWHSTLVYLCQDHTQTTTTSSYGTITIRLEYAAQ